MPYRSGMARIAIFDSGIGGTTVLDNVRARAPWADLIYVADHAFGPYGERTLEEVKTRTELLARYLATADVTEIVVACNSASAAALHHLRKVLPGLTFVGMEPAVKPASELTNNGIVAVLATGATFQGELFRSLVGLHATDVVLVEQACPGLAAAVEQGDSVGSLLDEFLAPVVASGADVVVLGCTHYPLIRNEIADRLPAGTTVVDPSDAVAKQVINVAHETGIDLKGEASTCWWTTDIEEDRGDERMWESIDVPTSATAAIRVTSTTVSAVEGDITDMPVEAVANAANVDLVHGGGIALAISQAGGPAIDDESADWINIYGPLVPGVAALTSAGEMPSSYVVHVAGPIYADGQENEELLTAAVLAVLDTVSEIEAASVAIPAISAGIYGYPADDATSVITDAVVEYLADQDTTLRSVRLVGFDPVMTERFAAAISSDT
jgi:glutamate racemase